MSTPPPEYGSWGEQPAYGTPPPPWMPPAPAAGPTSETPARPPAALPDPEQAYAVPSQRGSSRSGAAKAGVGALAGLGWLAKLGALAKFVLVVAKFKVALSMAISIAFYALVWGWRFAVGFVLLMFVHELGHVVELRRQGIKASAPMFIPFVGAFVGVHEQPRSARHEATMAFAGPLAGTVATTAVLYFAQFSGSQLLMALAYTGFFLNLFNLIPLPPLDGGRVAGALHPALWAAGLAAALWFVWHHPNPVLVLVILLGVGHMVRAWRDRAAKASYYAIPAQERALVAAAYVGLAAWCVWGMHVSYVVPPR